MIKKVLQSVKYLLIVLVVLFVQCQGEKKPAGLLSHDEMVSLMVEVYMAEARISTKGIPKDSAAKLFGPLEKSLLAKRSMGDSALRISYSYYLEKPKELEKILDAVIDTLNLREQRHGAQP